MYILLPLILMTTLFSSIVTYSVNHYIDIPLLTLICVFISSLIPSAQITRLILLWFYSWDYLRDIGKTKAEVEYIVKNNKYKDWRNN